MASSSSFERMFCERGLRCDTPVPLAAVFFDGRWAVPLTALAQHGMGREGSGTR